MVTRMTIFMIYVTKLNADFVNILAVFLHVGLLSTRISTVIALELLLLLVNWKYKIIIMTCKQLALL